MGPSCDEFDANLSRRAEEMLAADSRDLVDLHGPLILPSICLLLLPRSALCHRWNRSPQRALLLTCCCKTEAARSDRLAVSLLLADYLAVRSLQSVRASYLDNEPALQPALPSRSVQHLRIQLRPVQHTQHPDSPSPWATSSRAPCSAPALRGEDGPAPGPCTPGVRSLEERGGDEGQPWTPDALAAAG